MSPSSVSVESPVSTNPSLERIDRWRVVVTSWVMLSSPPWIGTKAPKPRAPRTPSSQIDTGPASGTSSIGVTKSLPCVVGNMPIGMDATSWRIAASMTVTQGAWLTTWA